MRVTYENPVWPGTMADPFVLRHGGAYYAYGTAPRDERTGREFRLLRSDDLAEWQDMGGALEPLGDPACTSYWAPEVAARDGHFVMYYSAGGDGGAGHRVRAAVAESPLGPFHDTGRALLPDEPFSIDASPFQDPADGRWYLFFAKDFLQGERPGTGTAVVPLADDGFTPLSPPRPVVRATADWQIYERDRTWYGRTWPAWHTVEGPFVVQHGGRYWCFTSGGRWESDGYGVGVAVADHPLGPWSEPAPGPCVLRGRPGALGPGHNSAVLGPDGATLFLVYHAWDAARSARRMHIDPVRWTERGPVCAGPSIGPQPLPSPIG